mgnify:CR=1 FL=1
MKEVNKQSCPTGISRREFLGMAATGAAALTILPSFTVAGLGHVAPSDKLYIAKIGCGDRRQEVIQDVFGMHVQLRKVPVEYAAQKRSDHLSVRRRRPSVCRRS